MLLNVNISGSSVYGHGTLRIYLYSPSMCKPSFDQIWNIFGWKAFNQILVRCLPMITTIQTSTRKPFSTCTEGKQLEDVMALYIEVT